jgi:hypothetical protein
VGASVAPCKTIKSTPHGLFPSSRILSLAKRVKEISLPSGFGEKEFGSKTPLATAT